MTRPGVVTPSRPAPHPDPYPFSADLVANGPCDAASGPCAAAGYATRADPARRVRPGTAPPPRGIPAGEVCGEPVRRIVGDGGPTTAARAGDAPAEWVRDTVLVLARRGQPEVPAFAAEAAPHDALTRRHRRVARATSTVGQDVPAGPAIPRLIAAANRDPMADPDAHAFRPGRADPRELTLGRGAHRRPGPVVAAAITHGRQRHGDRGALPEGYRPSPHRPHPRPERAARMTRLRLRHEARGIARRAAAVPAGAPTVTGEDAMTCSRAYALDHRGDAESGALARRVSTSSTVEVGTIRSVRRHADPHRGARGAHPAAHRQLDFPRSSGITVGLTQSSTGNGGVEK